MTTRTFTYSGPAQSLDLRVPGEADGETVLEPRDFVPGGTVELPAEHPVTIAMAAAGFLSEALLETAVAALTTPKGKKE